MKERGSKQFRVRISAEAAELVEELAGLLKIPSSRLLGDWVVEALPGMRATLQIIRAADLAKAEVREHVAEKLGELEKLGFDLVEALDRESQPEFEFEDVSDGARALAERSARSVGDIPPTSNRGAPKLNKRVPEPSRTGKG